MGRSHTAQYPAGALGSDIRSIEELYFVNTEQMIAYVDERAGLKTYVKAESGLRLAYFRLKLKMPASAVVKRVHISRIRAMKRQELTQQRQEAQLRLMPR